MPGFDDPRGRQDPGGYGGDPGGYPGSGGYAGPGGYGGQPGYPDRQQGYPDQRYSGQPGQRGQDYPDQGYGDRQYGRDQGLSGPGPAGQPGYPGQQGYPGQPGSGGHQGPPGQRGYDSYATSRVYGAPRGPQAAHATGGGPGPGGRRRRKPLILITSAAVVVVVAIAAVVFVVTRHGSGPVKGFATTGSTPAQDAQQVTTAFLTQWKAGDYALAASYTDNPAAAQAALAAYGKSLGLKSMTATFQGATEVAASPSASGGTAPSASATAATPHESVTFLVNDKVSAPYNGKALAASWSYHSKLVAYQVVPGSPGWYVAWQPDVLAPNLTTATHLAAVAVPPKVQMVSDNNGTALTSYKDPGLNTIAGILAADAPPGEGGTPGLAVEIQNAKGASVPNSQAMLIQENDIPTLGTTITPQAESAARAAVGQHANSSMVAIQPSTGRILAIANNAGFNDFALTAQVAPGSTMKVITSAALFNAGVLTPTSPVACPLTFTIQGITYHNDQNETLPAGTPFVTDFAQSCNNAFTTQWSHLNGQNSLAATAKTYFGLNSKWGIGIPGITASYFNAPASASGSELAEEAFGEGKLTASPIAMASVAATVDTGTFKQPILLQNASQATATPLPAATDAGLKQLMRAVVTSGTAAGIGFGPTVYAKTGTAAIPGQQAPNSWLIAFDPAKDVAVACLVTNAGYGAQFAGPEVKSFLDAY